MSTEAERQEKEQQRDNLKQRAALNNAYAVIEGTKYTTSALAFTFEEAVDLQIERISGTGTRIRPSELDRVDTVEAELLQAVEQIKAIPPEAFIAKIRGRDVNSEEDPEEES